MLKTRSKEAKVETEESEWQSPARYRITSGPFPPQYGALKLLLLLLTSDTLCADIFLVGHDCTISMRKKKIS